MSTTEQLKPRPICDGCGEYHDQCLCPMNSIRTELADLRAKLAVAEKERDRWQALADHQANGVDKIGDSRKRQRADLSSAQLQLRVLRDALEKIANNERVSSITSNPGYIPRVIAREALANTSTTEIQTAIDGAANGLKEAFSTIEALHGPSGWCIYEKNAPEMKRIDAALAQLAPFVSNAK